MTLHEKVPVPVQYSTLFLVLVLVVVLVGIWTIHRRLSVYIIVTYTYATLLPIYLDHLLSRPSIRHVAFFFFFFFFFI
ncbi:hypothetical protein GGR50DRAFT_681079, partial [Xylaria sp. CBS 124048]